MAVERAGLAQLVEHFSCKEDVVGSIPAPGSESVLATAVMQHAGVSLAFAVRLVPASFVGAKLSSGLAGGAQRRAFGWFVIGFGTMFTLYRLAVA